MQSSLAAFALMVRNRMLAFSFPLKVSDLGLDSERAGLLLSIFWIVALIVFLTPINWIYDRFSSIPLVLLGLILIGVALMMLSFIPGFASSILAMIVCGGGFALVFPAMNQIVSEASSKVDRGKAYGIFYAFFSLGAVAGSFISGTVAEVLGLPFLVSAAIMLGSAFVLWIISRKTGKVV